TFASAATGISAVPAVNIGITLLEGSSSFCSRTIALADSSYVTFGNFLLAHYLLGGLSGTVNHLRKAPPNLPVVVDMRKPQILERHVT
ncbi:MAG: hypothetical protein ACYST6_07725, partial [Planctomycetota bacterium]